MSKYSASVCTCSECVFIDLSDRNRYDREEAWCTKLRMYIDKNSRACRRYFEYDENRNSVNGTCYLTTIISEVLGYRDDCNYLEILRKFRDEYMMTDPNLDSIIYEYDTIGPILAKSIREDDQKQELCAKLFATYIEPVISLITCGKYLSAISKYGEMVTFLKTRYQSNIEQSFYDKAGQVTGKGYLKKK